MEELIIVDGYNILHAWPELVRLSKKSSLEHARRRLVEVLHNYQGLKGCQLIVVFDAHYVPNSAGNIEYLGNTKIIYSGKGQTADTVIEKLVAEWADKKSVYVATSDYNEQKVIFGKGAYRISAREMIYNLKSSFKEVSLYYSEEPHYRDTELGYRLKGSVKEIFEKWRREK